MIKIFINFKNFERASGGNAVRLAKICEKVIESEAKRGDVTSRRIHEFILIPNFLDLAAVKKAVDLAVFAPGFDVAGFGASTGAVDLAEIVNLGIGGVVLNHAENLEKNKEVLAKKILAAKKAGVKTVVCAENEKMVRFAAENGADFVAFEPRDLIGGRKSVFEVEREKILDFVSFCGEKLILGAGVHSNSDLEKAGKLGVGGVLIASAIADSENAESALREILG